MLKEYHYYHTDIGDLGRNYAKELILEYIVRNLFIPDFISFSFLSIVPELSVIKLRNYD